MAIPSDNSTSAQRIVHCLRGYSLSLEHWAPDMAETAGDVGYRKTLHALREEMTPAQREQMAALDARAAALYARHKGEPDPFFDIAALADFVAIAESERHAA
jgi:hypothetical protein